MESCRPTLAALGLFLGGLAVGSCPGGNKGEGTALAATRAPDPTSEPRPRARGPMSPALRKLAAIERRGDPQDVEPPTWRSTGAKNRRAPRATGLDPRGRSAPDDDRDDPLAGLRIPDLPIARNAHVLKYIRYFAESHEGRKIFAEALRRSGRFEEIMRRALRERGLPEDLLAVVFIESGFSPLAVSPAGAAGLWQFMPTTARAYGLVIESTIDERASIWRSTEAAAHHLSDLHERYRSWELALAAYNLGYAGLERRMDEFDVDDFWSLADAPGALPKETAHYVPKVLAAAVVFANLDQFGFADVDRAPPIDASELDARGGTRLDVVAQAAGTSLRVLRELNPELLADIVPDRGAQGDEGPKIHIPRSGLARARTMLPALASAEGNGARPRVSEDFDWGKDDVRSGRSRLERTSHFSSEKSVLGPRRRRHRRLGASSTRKSKLRSQAEETASASRDERRDAPRAPRDERREDTDARERDEPRVRRDERPSEPRGRRDESRGQSDERRDEARAQRGDSTRAAEPREPSDAPPRSTPAPEPMARVFYRVVAGDSVQRIAATVGLTVDQVLAQAHVGSAAEIRVGTLLDLRVPTVGVHREGRH